MESKLTKNDVIILHDRIIYQYYDQKYPIEAREGQLKDLTGDQGMWYLIWEKYEEYVRLVLPQISLWGNIERINQILDRPLSEMPLLINETREIALIAKWRIEIGK